MRCCALCFIVAVFILVAGNFQPFCQAEEETDQPSEEGVGVKSKEEKPSADPDISEKSNSDNKNKDQDESVNKPSVLFLDAAKKVTVYLKLGTVAIPAETKINAGLIELALGSTSSPNCRSHESLFITDAKPSLVHAGLQLIGLKPGKCVDYNGQSKLPSGDGLYIYVVWKDKDKEHRFRLEKLIFNTLAQEPVTDIKWIFTGSQMVLTEDKEKKKKQFYDADEEGTIIATWHCSSTVIDISLPEGSNDEAFEAYKKNMPARGSKVAIIFSSRLRKPREPLTSPSDSGQSKPPSKKDKVPEAKSKIPSDPLR